MANRGSARRAPFVVRGSKRDTFWISLALSAEIAVAANSGVLIVFLTSAQMFAAEMVDSTIIRTRGSVLWFSDQAVAVESPSAAFGLKLQNEKAVVAGAASVPFPAAQPDQDWFVWEPLLAVGANDANNRGSGKDLHTVDSKAMRKISGQDSLIGVVENQSAADGGSFNLIMHMLVKVG